MDRLDRVLITLIDVQEIAIATAGVAAGILALIILSTVREVRLARRRILNGDAAVSHLITRVERLQMSPDDLDAQTSLLHALTRLADSTESVDLITYALSQTQATESVTRTVARSSVVRRWIDVQSTGSPEHRVSVLELIAVLGSPEMAPALLAAAADECVDVRRAALRAMASIVPTKALDISFRSVPTEGPWILERLTQLVRRPGLLDEFVAVHGTSHLIEMVSLLSEVLVGDDERRALAAIDTLAAIDHPASAAALLRTARGGHAMLAFAAADALRHFAEGRLALREAHGLKPAGSVPA